MDRKKISDFAPVLVVAIINICAFTLGAESKEIEVSPPKADTGTTHDLNYIYPVKPAKVSIQTVAQCYCWVDANGNMTWGQLKNVPMECFQGFDKIKGWSRGLIQKPVVGR